MAATVVFVHGTGVRGGHYVAEFDRVRSNIVGRRPDITVLPCRWGDQLGAQMHASGASVPVEAGALRELPNSTKLSLPAR